MRSLLTLESLDSYILPATLSLSGGLLLFADIGSENNTATFAVSAGVESIKDTATVITLDGTAIAAGWKGDGTNTASGPESSFDSIEIDAGGGTNQINLRSTDSPVTINGDSGTTSINLNSAAPTNSGNLAGLHATVIVNAGDATSLWAADVTGVSRPNSVTVSTSSITGLAPHDIDLTGTFTSIRVSGSNSSLLAESYLLESVPAAAFQLDTLGGNDSVEVAGDITGNASLGAGDDTFTVDFGFTWFGNVDTGSGSDVVYYGAPDYGDITGTVN